jgi:hypothetical protein
MRKIDIKEAASFLAGYAPKAGEDPVVLMRGKKPVAVILPTGKADMETISLGFSPVFRSIMRESARSLAREGGISSEDLRREFGLPPFQSKRQELNGRKRSTANRSKRRSSVSRLKAGK